MRIAFCQGANPRSLKFESFLEPIVLHSLFAAKASTGFMIRQMFN